MLRIYKETLSNLLPSYACGAYGHISANCTSLSRESHKLYLLDGSDGECLLFILVTQMKKISNIPYFAY